MIPDPRRSSHPASSGTHATTPASSSIRPASTSVNASAAVTSFVSEPTRNPVCSVTASPPVQRSPAVATKRTTPPSAIATLAPTPPRFTCSAHSARTTPR